MKKLVLFLIAAVLLSAFASAYSYYDRLAAIRQASASVQERLSNPTYNTGLLSERKQAAGFDAEGGNVEINKGQLMGQGESARAVSGSPAEQASSLSKRAMTFQERYRAMAEQSSSFQQKQIKYKASTERYAGITTFGPVTATAAGGEYAGRLLSASATSFAQIRPAEGDYSKYSSYRHSVRYSKR